MENILATWKRFLRGKRHKTDVAFFEAELGTNLYHLFRDLKEKKYMHAGYSAFVVADPKPRHIHKASVRDRVVHHLLYKALYPYFDPRFIYDSYSCRNNKGVHAALIRFRTFARRVSKNNTRTCYVLSCDIRKFFASIDHEVLRNLLKRHITDSDLLWLIDQIILSFHSTRPGVGLPLGNLTSQLLVNVYMHELDAYLKQELRVKHYIRYADDFVILSDDKRYLEELLPHIATFLTMHLHLSLHEDKVHITSYVTGVDFLGWVHFPHYRQIRRTTARKIARALKGFPTVEARNSYRGLLTHGNTYRFRKKIGLAT